MWKTSSKESIVLRIALGIKLLHLYSTRCGLVRSMSQIYDPDRGLSFSHQLSHCFCECWSCLWEILVLTWRAFIFTQTQQGRGWKEQSGCCVSVQMVPWADYVHSWRIHIARFGRSPPALVLSFPSVFICLMVYEYHRSQEQSGCAASSMTSDRTTIRKK